MLRRPSLPLLEPTPSLLAGRPPHPAPPTHLLPSLAAGSAASRPPRRRLAPLCALLSCCAPGSLLPPSLPPPLPRSKEAAAAARPPASLMRSSSSCSRAALASRIRASCAPSTSHPCSAQMASYAGAMSADGARGSGRWRWRRGGLQRAACVGRGVLARRPRAAPPPARPLARPPARPHRACTQCPGSPASGSPCPPPGRASGSGSAAGCGKGGQQVSGRGEEHRPSWGGRQTFWARVILTSCGSCWSACSAVPFSCAIPS